MKLCIIGIAGLLGSNLAYCLKNKYRVAGIDRHEVEMKDVDAYNLDITDYKKVEEVLKRIKPDVIVHCIAEVNVDRCEANREKAYITNVDVTRKLIEISEKLNCKMIYISTDAVFDGENRKLYTEEDITNPINYYGKTKLIAEEYVLEKSKNLVLRTNIYGYNYRNKKSLTEWMVDSLLENEAITLFDDVIISPILVNEFSRILEKIIDNDLYGIYNLCGTGSISKYEIGKVLKEELKINSGEIIKGSIEEFNFIASRGKNLSLSNEKLRKALNIDIQTPMESLCEYVQLWEKGYCKKFRVKTER